jgi:hypothetical protein
MSKHEDPNALCFHVWICSQVWLNLPSDNCPLFPHLPTDDGHFGYKQKQFAKKKTYRCYYYHMVEEWVPLK